MAVTALKIVQLGKETTWGTAVAATSRLMGVLDASLHVADEVQRVEELGTLVPAALVAETYQGGEGKVELQATYEDILYILHGIFGAVSPSGAGPYTWTYSAPGSSAPTPQAYTVEFGAPGAHYKMAGGLMTKMTIEGEAGDLWKATADLVGKAISTVTPASLSDRTVEVIRMADTSLYVDAWTGTMGSTEVPATLRSFSLEVDTGRHLKRMAGSLTPAAYGEGRWDGTLSITAEFNSSAKAWVDELLGPALVRRQIEIRASSGQKSVKLQFCGTLADGAELFADADGNVVVELKFAGTYNASFGNWLKVIVVNNVSALP